MLDYILLNKGLKMNDNKNPIFYKTQIAIIVVLYVLALKAVGFFEILSNSV